MESAYILLQLKNSKEEALVPFQRKLACKEIIPIKKKKAKKTVTIKRKKRVGRRTCVLRMPGEVTFENGQLKVNKDIHCISSIDRKGNPIMNRASVRFNSCLKFFCFPNKHHCNCFEAHKELNVKCKNASSTLISNL